MDSGRGEVPNADRRWPVRSTLAFRVPVEAHAIRTVRKTIESFAADRGFSESKVRDLSLAVAEALFNAMEHGNQGDSTIGIHVEFAVDELQVAVEDDGAHGENDERYLDLKRALDGGPGETPEVDLERGRGLFLIRAKADEVRVERAPFGGVRVVMVKRR